MLRYFALTRKVRLSRNFEHGQHHHAPILCAAFHPTRLIRVENIDINSFMSLSEVLISLRQFLTKLQEVNKHWWASSVASVVQIGRKT